LLASLLRLYTAASSLPERMASHFDAQGVANGFQSRAGFLGTCAGFELGLFILFAALPTLMHALPSQLINLPHRDHWLQPDRKVQSLARAAGLLDWFLMATLALMAATFELTLRANQQRTGLDSRAMWLLLAADLAFTVSWIVRLVRAFPRPSP
jgi:uncharacterized membrane protein